MGTVLSSSQSQNQQKVERLHCLLEINRNKSWIEGFSSRFQLELHSTGVTLFEIDCLLQQCYFSCYLVFQVLGFLHNKWETILSVFYISRFKFHLFLTFSDESIFIFFVHTFSNERFLDIRHKFYFLFIVATTKFCHQACGLKKRNLYHY